MFARMVDWICSHTSDLFSKAVLVTSLGFSIESAFSGFSEDGKAENFASFPRCVSFLLNSSFFNVSLSSGIFFLEAGSTHDSVPKLLYISWVFFPLKHSLLVPNPAKQSPVFEDVLSLLQARA